MSSALLLCPLIVAQQSGMIEGTVVSSITGLGVEGVAVTMYTQDAVRYTATTDASGAFRVIGVAPGTYYARLEKADYTVPVRSDTGYRVGSGLETPRPRLYVSRNPAVRGRVLDPRGEAASGVRVSIPGGGGSAVTNAQGEFEIKGLLPGAYMALATPPSSNAAVQAIPTYSARFVARHDDVERVDIRLEESEVYRLSGTVLGETGDPVPNARVTLQPIRQLEPRSGGGTTFPVFPAMRGTGAAEATATTDERGRFEFFPVRRGDWFLQGEVAGPIDSPTFIDSIRSGGEEVRMGRNDIEGISVLLRTPFPFRVPYVRVTPAFGGGLVTVSQEANRMILPGTYILLPSAQPGRYVTSIRMDGREVMGQPVALINASQRVEATIADARGVVQGRVIGDAGTVVLIPAQQEIMGTAYSAPVRDDGTFSLTGVAPGDYQAAAMAGYNRVGSMAMDAVLLQRIATLGTRVRVAQDGSTAIELRPMQWLE